jgi:hemin uptake protein HemP
VKARGDEPDAMPSAVGARAAQAPTATPPSSGPARPGVPAPAVRAIASEALFGGACEVQIHHRGALYRLKQTALGKLILTK